MDFHLSRDSSDAQWQWLFAPISEINRESDINKLGNAEVLREDGELVGIIVGWSDINMCQFWNALREPKLELAKSLLASADGTFARVFYVEESIFVVTDVSGSIPIFLGCNRDRVHIASKADMAACAFGKPSLDLVSVADFLQNGAVCHPFSLFEGVRVFPPASISRVHKGQVVSSYYWTPDEKSDFDDFTKTAGQLRETIRSVLVKGLTGTSNATVMFSGGEDARSLVPLLPEKINLRLKLIADGENREYVLACKSAEKLGFKAELVTRDSNHYRKKFHDKVQWVGPGNDVRHLHVFGSTVAIMDDAGAVVGGLGSDKLFKSDYLANVVNKAKDSFLPERLAEPCPETLVRVGTPDEMKWMRGEIAEAVWRRHQSHHAVLHQFRPRSSGNWHTLWPLGGHSQAHSQFLSNIRYGPRVVEPFFAASSYKLAAAIPDEWKVDRKIFTAALAPGMGAAAWVPTTAGRLPALNGFKGRLVQFAIKSWRVAYDEWNKKRNPSSYGAQGPWSSDHKAFEFKPCEYMDDKVLGKLNKSIDAIVAPCIGSVGFWNQEGAAARERRVMAIQVGQVISED